LATIWRSGSSSARSTILMPASWSWLSPLRPLMPRGAQDQRHAAAGHDAFFDRGTGRVQRVFDAGLLLLHLDFGRGTDLDQRNTAGQLGHALLQLLAVVVAGGFLDLRADLLTRPSIASSPAPSMMVVFSLPISMRLAWPRSFSVTFSSDRPTSSRSPCRR
jgi:hypothetical protein